MARNLNWATLMKIFDSEYEFKICEENEIEQVLDFYAKYWNENHAIIKSRKLLNWMYYDEINKLYNFMFAKHKESEEIHACTAFVYSNHFDFDIKEPIRWCGMTKARPDYNYSGIGVILLEKLQLLKPAIESAGLGLSLDSRKLLRYDTRGHQKSPLFHYFLLNSQISDFHIAFNGSGDLWYNDKAIIEKNKKMVNIDLLDYEKLNVIKLNAIPSYKSKTYYINRFYKHPIYKYNASAIYNNNDLQAVVFWRKNFANGSCCLRIVDYFGIKGALSGTKLCFEQLLIEHNAEYIDFLFAGIDTEEVKAAGFIDRRINDKWIIPEYFEPFERVNKDVFFTPPIENAKVQLTIFKGDSDQDRPNLVN